MTDTSPALGVGVFMKGPNCMKCHHFAISWDPLKPYSCRLMGFKSRRLPSMDVLSVDGTPCQGYADKRNAQAGQAVPAPAGHKTPSPSGPALRSLRSTQMWEA